LQAQGIDRGIAIPILDPGARRGRVDCVSPRPLYTRERDPELTASCWVDLVALWMDLKNFATTGVPTPDIPLAASL